MEPLDPWFLDENEVRAALAARDIGTLYRLLRRLGVSQRQIARLTGQSQSEVSEILQGRHVRDVRVLERITDGLGIPRARMGLSYGEQGPDSPVVEEEVEEDVKRRVVLAATLGQPLLSLGKPITLALPPSDPPPSRLSMVHVQQVRTVADQLLTLARYYGGQAGPFRDAVTRYTPWMAVPAPDEVKTALAAALAELHTEAGWYCHDSGLDPTGYFTRGLPLAHRAGDAYGVAKAAWSAGATLVRSGHPNDALKLFQLGGFWASKSTSRTEDPRLPTITAWLHLNSATAYALLGSPDQATHYLAKAHTGWEPRNAYERAGTDRATAAIHLDLGQLEAAEQFVTSALRSYRESHRNDRTMAELLLAEIHVRAGEPQGLTLARQAIDKVSALHSIAARRQRLLPLATALQARPGTDTQELARIARQVATTRI